LCGGGAEHEVCYLQLLCWLLELSACWCVFSLFISLWRSVICVQTVQGKLSKCGEMLNDIPESVAGEDSMVMCRDELSRLHRRHAQLSEKISKQCERIGQAVQLRDSYWTRRRSLEVCLEDCRHKMTYLDVDGADDDDRLAQLEASYCCFFVVSK